MKLLIAGISAAILVTGCGVTQDGFSSNSLQKRKYTKGFYISKRSHLKAKEDNAKIEATVESEHVNDEQIAVLKKKTVGETSTVNQSVVPQKRTTEVQSSENVETSVNETKTVSEQSSSLSSNENASIKTKNTTSKEVKSVLKKHHKKSSSSAFADDLLIICVILCFLIPPLAVGVWTNIDWMKVLISFLLTCLFVLPGIIYSLLVVLDKI